MSDGPKMDASFADTLESMGGVTADASTPGGYTALEGGYGIGRRPRAPAPPPTIDSPPAEQPPEPMEPWKVARWALIRERARLRWGG
jgi:hypothetical protein